MNAYANKLLARAEGIWHNLGLALQENKSLEHDGYTSISLYFDRITPAQAEMLVSQMSKAFRRANVYWKEDERGTKICVEIPPMGSGTPVPMKRSCR